MLPPPPRKCRIPAGGDILCRLNGDSEKAIIILPFEGLSIFDD